MQRVLCLLAASLLAGGCILEDNPDFVDAAETGGTGADGGSEGGTTVFGTGTADGGSDDTTDGSEDTGGSDSGGPIGGDGYGCDDPELCRTLHVGPITDSCPHEVDGAMSIACDAVGTFGLRIAVDTLAYYGEGGLIVLHDNSGTLAEYVGNVDVTGNVTIRTADGVDPRDVVIWHETGRGIVRLREDDTHLAGFTLGCNICEWAITTRSDPDLEVAGTETGYHLIENVIVAAPRPEHVGGNNTAEAIQSLGPDSILRNSHVWGYWEGTLDLSFANDSVVSHNTWLAYQNIDADALLDVRSVDGIVVSNNVFASLTRSVQGVALANDGTKNLTVTGNVAEGFTELVSGIGDEDPDLTASSNVVGPLELESPRTPLVLADSDLTATGAAEGISLDGVPLEDLEDRVPGAYQQRSTSSLPRRTVITVGESDCGGSSCTVDKGFQNELQVAAHSAWPGARVELYPSGEPYAGPVVISWPIELVGVGTGPEDVLIEETIEDEFLSDYGQWSGNESSVIDVLRGSTEGVRLDNFTVLTGPGHRAVTYEGNSGQSVSPAHEASRLILRDPGNLEENEWASPALYIGDGVIVHDVLVHGEFTSCVRFGPRSTGSAATPVSEAFVYNLTCRLTKPRNAPNTLVAFEVASVDGGIIANAAVEMAQEGPLFRAQRRSSGDADPLNAADKPAAFHAEAIAAQGHDALYDGFTDADGTYTLVAVDAVLPGDPFFVSATDSHLDALSIAIDSGIDPSTLNGLLSLGTSVDGTDREMAVPDRGCYEQGL